MSTGETKPLQNSPSTMQDAFGCVVANRFLELPEDCDPLDLLYEASVAISHHKKKDAASAKKAGKQKGSKESQKDRRSTSMTGTESQSEKCSQKQTLQKVTQNEISNEVKMGRTDRNAFREFGWNTLEKPVEFSVNNFEKGWQVRNWVANQRLGMRGRGRGFPRNLANENQRGKREFERQSGSDRTRIRAEDKRGGSGLHNWGSFNDALSEAEPAPVENVETIEQFETMEEKDVKVLVESDDYAKEMSLDEWKSMIDQNRPKAEFNLRKPESSVPSKAVVIHKSKLKTNAEDDEAYHYAFRKPVNDITSQLDINFGNLPRPGRGGRGGGRGRVRREEAFQHEVIDVHDFSLNPDDPNDFPALS